MSNSPQSRADKVAAATLELSVSVAAAVAAMTELGPEDPRTRSAWEIVEKSSATVHRQSRLLAGKPRGG